ncbi:alpha-(1,3)-fucosyltransferase 7-like [Dermacentor andersoni]|uniref:alpha-(1,3)-fucosyltransferase 7-like n=1 Tax=Dermacentor andersoni TaxID=34620 RepID=UPI003B3A36F8
MAEEPNDPAEIPLQLLEPLIPQAPQGAVAHQELAENDQPSRRFCREKDKACCRVSVALISSFIIALAIYGTYNWFTCDSSQPARPPRPSSLTKEMSPWLRWDYRDGDVRVPRILVWTDPPSEISEAPSIGAASGLGASKDSTPQHSYWTSCHFITNYPYDVPEQCAVTNDRRLLMESDLIVFHADRVNASDFPKKRSTGQLWIFLARTHPTAPTFVGDIGLLGAISDVRVNVSPSALPMQLSRVFNWTMSRREDATVPIVHKNFGPGFLSSGNLSISSTNTSGWSPMPTRLHAAWIASDCERQRFREEQEKLRSLNDGLHYLNDVPIRLQVLPNCGAGQCHSLADCVAQVAKNFKFIVVAAMPACFQSVHELVYEAFEHDLVPIVLASSNITLNVPPKSVVNAADWLGPGRLHAHLRTLLDHPAEYESYFAWKRSFTVSTLEDELCSLCQAFQKGNLTVGPTRLDVREWWELRARCRVEPLFGVDALTVVSDFPTLANVSPKR